MAEVKFDTLKKSHKKQVIIGALAICVIGGALTFATSRARYKLTEDIPLVTGNINYKPYDFKVMAMYQSDDGANYNEINKMPGKNYKINEEKSYCTIDNIDHDNEAKLYTNKYGEHIIGSLSKTEKCYVYFDKNTEIVSTSLGNIEVNNYQPYFSQVATTDEGVFKANDNDGVSYYWRGATTTNYLQFGGYCWRIVRINGDGTIRLIYDGTTCHANGEVTTDSIAVSDVKYNISCTQSNYVGWTYEGQLKRPDENETESNAKEQLENWYSSNITETNATKVADGKYCNDRNVQSGNTWSAIGANFNYVAYKRLYTDYMPSLACDSSDVYALKVGLLTVDEVMYAGSINTDNQKYYLYNGQNYWTISPSRWNNNLSRAYVFRIDVNGKLGWDVVNSGGRGLRPVINLKSDITISGGDGTLNNPYIVS